MIISLEETEKDVGPDNNTDCNQVNGRSKLKRSASEMELDPTYIVDENIYKRSKLAAALIQQPRQQSRSSASFSFSSLTTGATSLAIRKEHFHQYQTIMGGGCSTWEQPPALNPVTVGLPSLSIKSLPVLSKKELSILPALSDCSNSGGSGVNSTNNNSQNVCCSVASGSAPSSASCCWKSGGNGADNSQPLSQSSFESCDSGWMGADDSYDLNTWKNIQNKLNNIVSIWIHDKNESVFSNAFYDHHFLIRCSCVDALLHYTAAVLVTSNLYTVLTDCIVYELVVLSSPFFQYFLYYVISVYFVAHVQYNWLYIFLHK